jgi:hypothetical protein
MASRKGGRSTRRCVVSCGANWRIHAENDAKRGVGGDADACCLPFDLPS